MSRSEGIYTPDSKTAGSPIASPNCLVDNRLQELELDHDKWKKLLDGTKCTLNDLRSDQIGPRARNFTAAKDGHLL